MNCMIIIVAAGEHFSFQNILVSGTKLWFHSDFYLEFISTRNLIVLIVAQTILTDMNVLDISKKKTIKYVVAYDEDLENCRTTLKYS